VLVEHELRFCKMLVMHLKSEAGDLIIKALKWFERQTGQKCKELQCDGAGEFIGPNTSLYSFVIGRGMQYRISPPHTPQSNGVAEIYRKIHNETGLTIRKAGQVPDKFWPKSEEHAAYVDAMIVTRGRTITGFEKLFEYQPNSEWLRAFGCHAFAYVDVDLRNKFATHTHPCIYMGVVENYAAYKLYDPISMEFFVTDSCLFDEFRR
jgi:hypothetical protein